MEGAEGQMIICCFQIEEKEDEGSDEEVLGLFYSLKGGSVCYLDAG